jgi:immunity protein 8 of polymorphic toxin system
LHSPDALDLKGYEPDDPANFGILVEATIGSPGSPGGDTFSFVTCTPSWLAQEWLEGEYRFGRHLLLLRKYDYNILWNAIEKLCHSVEGKDWDEVAQKLSRYGYWEFEDIQEGSS